MKYKLQIPAGEASMYLEDCDDMLMRNLYEMYWSDGYMVVDLEDVDVEGIIRDVNSKIVSGDYLSQNQGYQYSDSPRIFEAWRYSQPVLDLARHPKILSLLQSLYGRKPFPFQTINFKKGSNQPLHSDLIHFHTQPERWVVGVWVALEDMDESNGTLQIVPGSHTLPVITLQDLRLEKVDPDQPKSELDKQQIEKYRVYEEFVSEQVEYLEVIPQYIKKGQALVWSANLLHGGAPILDESRTRWSQATHYFFEGCNHYYAPMFSDPSRGEYADKDLSTKDIMNHVIR